MLKIFKQKSIFFILRFRSFANMSLFRKREVDVKSTHMEESVTSDNKEQKIKKD
jgi:hypothetical protein